MRFPRLLIGWLVLLCLKAGTGYAQSKSGSPAAPTPKTNPAAVPSKADPVAQNPAAAPNQLVLGINRNGQPLKQLPAQDYSDLLATYSVSLGPTTFGVGKDTVQKGLQTVTFAPDNFQPDVIAAQLLQKLRADDNWAASRRKLGEGSYWAQVLYPHGSVWPWRWHWRKERRLGWRRERNDSERFRQQLSHQLAETAQKSGLKLSAYVPPAPAANFSGPGPTVSDHDQEPVLVKQPGVQLAGQVLVGQLHREADPLQPGFYHLTLHDPQNQHVRATTSPWRPGQAPETEQIVNELLEASVAADLRTYYKTDSDEQFRKLTGKATSLEELRKQAENALAALRKLATQDTSMAARLSSLYNYRQSVNLPDSKAMVDSARSVFRADSAARVLLKNSKGKLINLATEKNGQSNLKTGTKPEVYTAQYTRYTKALANFKKLATNQADTYFRDVLRMVLRRQTYEKSLALPANQSPEDAVRASQQPYKVADAAWAELKGRVKSGGANPAIDSTQAVQALQLAAAGQQADSTIRQALFVAVARLMGRAVPSPATPASLVPNLLYSGQLLLPTQPSRRLARLYVHDRGQGVPANNRARYAVCLQYSATDGTFKDTPSEVSECDVPTGYVGVAVELAVLERSVFVNQLYDALTTKMRELTERTKAEKQNKSVAGQAQAAVTKAQIMPMLQVEGATQKQVVVAKEESTTSVKDAAGADSIKVMVKVIEQTAEELALRESLRDFFDDFIREQTKLAEAPRAGTVLLGQRLMTYRAMGDSAQASGHYFDVDSVAMEVEDGSAMGIKAYGKVENRQLLFETYAPLNLSSDFDLQHSWYLQRMFAQSSELLLPEAEHGLFLKLHETLRYYPLLLARTSDRSPANNVYMFRPQDPLSQRILRKDPTSKLLQARVFSDLVGIANDRPNGLLQVEVTKKFTLYNRFQAGGALGRKLQLGYLNYVQPTLTVSKIEDKSRFLEYQNAPDANPQVAPYPHYRQVRTIDLLRYANLRIGANQNLVHLKVPSIKSDFSLDYSVILSRVDVRDPQRLNQQKDRDSILNVVTYGPQLLWRVRPDSRFGAQFRVAVLIQKLFNDHEDRDSLVNARLPYRINRVKEDYGIAPVGRGHTVLGNMLRTPSQTILQAEMLLWADVSETSELFFRTQFSCLRYATYQTYFQLQLGYQFDVFTNRRTAVKPAALLPK